MSDSKKALDFINIYLDIDLDSNSKPLVDAQTYQWKAKRKPNPRDMLDALISKFGLDADAFKTKVIASNDDKSSHADISLKDWGLILKDLGKHYSIDLYVSRPGKGLVKATADEGKALLEKMKSASTYGDLVEALKNHYGEPSPNQYLRLGLAACCIGATVFMVARSSKRH